MRPPYYLFYNRSHAGRARTESNASGERFTLIACSLVMAGLVAVAFLSGW